MEVIFMKYGNQFSVTKSFHQWCIENNRLDLNERFDIEKNNCTTDDIGYQSNKKYWFKCPRGIHESEEFYITVLIKNTSTSGTCRKCNSVAQVIIDKFGEKYLWDHWHSSNILSPWDISSGSQKIKVIIQCTKRNYHIYEQTAHSFAIGIGCPYCINRKVHVLDSLGSIYPEVIKRWSNLNDKSPYEYSPHSDKKVWFKCPSGEHEDYLQKISGAVIYNFRCPKCSLKTYSENKRGENSRFWKGGIAKENDTLRHRREYKEWRDAVYERDDYTCQCCGKCGAKLNAHHIYPFSEYPELRYNINNGLTLCTECHDSTQEDSFHNMYGTHNNTPEELREYVLNKSNIDIYKTHKEILTLNNTCA